MKVDFASDPLRVDIRRVQVKEEDIRPVKPGQLDRLDGGSCGRNQMKVWLLDNQIDKRVHEFWMAADYDDSVAWNIFSNVSADVRIKRIGRPGTVSSYHQSKLF